MNQEHYGSFSYDDGTRLYPESAVTGNLSEDDRMNVEKIYGKKIGKILPPYRGIYMTPSPPPHTHTHTHTQLHMCTHLITGSLTNL